jgi:hypothetical protein
MQRLHERKAIKLTLRGLKAIRQRVKRHSKRKQFAVMQFWCYQKSAEAIVFAFGEEGLNVKIGNENQPNQLLAKKKKAETLKRTTCRRISRKLKVKYRRSLAKFERN